MKKMMVITWMALLLGSGIAGAETMGMGADQGKAMMATEQMQEGGAVARPANPLPTRPGPNDMGMLGQAMMPNMMNMMMAEPSIPGSMMGGKMMNMPMMGASMMPMGMGGLGMMPLMMGSTSEETAATLEKYRAFLKETKADRKELHDLSFAYFEARWAPETTVQQMQDMALKMRALRDKILAKMPK